MTCIVFENPGELEHDLIGSFGVNVKETEGAIGWFGTGLKYALAVLARTGHEVEIQSGALRRRVGTVRKTIRGREFDFVAVDGEALPFTTELGKSWRVWMAYRELWSNAVDEGGGARRLKRVPSPRAGRTRVVVRGEGIESVWSERRRYILEGEPIVSTPECDVHHGSGVFYKGILVHQPPNDMAYAYDIKTRIDLTEDRTMKYSYMASLHAYRAVGSCDDREVIERVVTAPNGSFEGRFDYTGEILSDAFVETVTSLSAHRRADVNPTAVREVERSAKGSAAPPPTELNNVEREQLARAVALLRDVGLGPRHEIVVVDSLGADVLGAAFGDRIFVTRRAFQMGTKYVAGTILEEHLHLKEGLLDATREMQNYLVDLAVTLAERIRGTPV